jgi:hypothetical protein
MNTPVFCKQLVALLLLTSLFACQKQYDNIYEVNEVSLKPNSSSKVKPKSNEQFVSILYTNLFQQALPGNQLVDLSDCIESIGDKSLAHQVIVSNFMNRPAVILPSNQTMRDNPDEFITATYKRFLVRLPTEGEKLWFTNFIQSNPTLTPELVYVAFALSNEYAYY